MATQQSSTMSTVLAVLGLGAGAIFLYEAFAPASSFKRPDVRRLMR